jgi:hypothetical protein
MFGAVGCRRASAGGLVSPPTAGARVYPSAPHSKGGFRANHVTHCSSMSSSAKQKCDRRITPVPEVCWRIAGTEARQCTFVRGLVENGGMVHGSDIFASTEPLEASDLRISNFSSTFAK